MAIYDALCSERARIRHLLGRHEQGLTYMADGYSRASGRLGVVTTTSGPGVANMACAMAQATTDTSSVLAVSSTVHSELIGKNRGGLHDHGESLEIMRAVCRYAVRCETVDEIPAAVHNLIVALRDGRPGGAYLETPCDVLGERAAVEILPAGQRSRPAPDDNAVCQAVELLADAQRPVLWVGTGATLSDAGAEVAELAERLGAAVVMIGDFNKERLDHAAKVGFTPVDLSKGDNLPEMIAEITGSPEVDAAVDAVGFEARGHSGGEQPAIVLNQMMEITRVAGGIGIPGLYVTEDPGAVDDAAKSGNLSMRFGLGWAKAQSFHTGQTPVLKYNRQLMQAILHDRLPIADIVNATIMPLDEAAEGYKSFDSGVAKKFVLDPHGMLAP